MIMVTPRDAQDVYDTDTKAETVYCQSTPMESDFKTTRYTKNPKVNFRVFRGFEYFAGPRFRLAPGNRLSYRCVLRSCQPSKTQQPVKEFPMNAKVRLLLTLLPVLMLATLLVAALAQTQPQAAQKAAPPLAPDRTAFTAANAVKEPDKKIEAFEKFVVDFPQSMQVTSAYQAIFSTLVKSYPDQKARILEQVVRALDKATAPMNKANLYNYFASQLLDAGIMTDDAERLAAAGLALIDDEVAKLPATPPPPATPPAQANSANPAGQASPVVRQPPDPRANFARLKSTAQVTMGRIYVRQGKQDAAEKNFKEAIAANPQLTAATLGLAEIYDKRGDSKSALTAYINAAAVSKLTIPQRQALNTLYAKSHKGSLAGLEEMLDAKYLEANPPPFHVEPYKPTEVRSDRIVLTEVFTGSGCPPCVAADLAAELAMERYGKDLAVIMYHAHIPQPDPMTTPQTTARFKYYAGTGVPTVVIDGVTSPGGGGPRDRTKSVFDRITKEIEKNLEVPADAKIKLSAARKGARVSARAVVDEVAREWMDLRLHILLVEGKLRYTGENGVRFHPMVVRSMAGADAPGLSIKSKGPETFTWDFDLNEISASIKQHLDAYEAGGHRGNSFTFVEKKYEINPEDLLVTAFVQDEKTKVILQSVLIPVK
jgi:thiol-disulfide isomerase/thioredoxin